MTERPATRRDALKAITFPIPAPAPVPRAELVNVIQYEEQARARIGRAKVAPVAGGDRTVTDRITLRPRINVPTRDLDLTCQLFGDAHFAPILVGPMAGQARFHTDGEVAVARGASLARAGMVASGDTPLPAVAAALTTPLWVEVADVAAARRAAAAKARALVVRVGGGGRADWTRLAAVAAATPLPVLAKGITRPEDARAALAHGARGVVVSNWRPGAPPDLPGTLLLIEPVVAAVGDRVPVLADGSFRYGTDVIKALGFGAKAVLVGRPVSWGLAAYGDDGVRGVVETLQTDLARIMAMCSRPTLAALDRSVVRTHSPRRSSDV